MIVHMIDEWNAKRMVLDHWAGNLFTSACDVLMDLRNPSQRTLIRENVTCPDCKKLLKVRLPL